MRNVDVDLAALSRLVQPLPFSELEGKRANIKDRKIRPTPTSAAFLHTLYKDACSNVVGSRNVGLKNLEDALEYVYHGPCTSNLS